MPNDPDRASEIVKPLTDEEIEGYRKRVTGATAFPGGPTPAGLEKARAMLDNWHLRNLATIDSLRLSLAESEERCREVVEAHRNNIRDQCRPHDDDPHEMRRWTSLRALAALYPPSPDESHALKQGAKP